MLIYVLRRLMMPVINFVPFHSTLIANDKADEDSVNLFDCAALQCRPAAPFCWELLLEGPLLLVRFSVGLLYSRVAL